MYAVIRNLLGLITLIPQSLKIRNPSQYNYISFFNVKAGIS